jgi:hypothetical protein
VVQGELVVELEAQAAIRIRQREHQAQRMWQRIALTCSRSLGGEGTTRPNHSPTPQLPLPLTSRRPSCCKPLVGW